MNANTQPALDVGRLTAMEDLFQGELPGALGRFLENARSYTGEIGRGVEGQQWQIVRDNAHKLKSSAAMFGMARVSALCIDIEARVNRAEYDGIPDLHASLASSVAAAGQHFAPFIAATGQSLRAWLDQSGALQ